MITLINYGSGNIKAITNIFHNLNMELQVAQDAEELKGATKLILPGVDSFDNAMVKLNRSGMRECLDEMVLGRRVPIIGICVGMQILGNSSDEGDMLGLGYIDGTVKRFDINSIPYSVKVPHMGWNSISYYNNASLFRNISQNSYFYFLHSYYFECNDKNNVMAWTRYGIDFASAIWGNNIFGVQFHPEKSHENGLKLFSNFAGL